MAAKLGGVFLTCAMGPVNYAGSCILASRMPEGILELAPEGLWGGLQRGIEQAAKLSGVPPQTVDRFLPGAELRACIERIAVSQPAALDAWRIYAGHIGGLLKGVAELTVDGRAPDASLCLERLAQKVRRDKPFSQPLQILADDVARWQELLSVCRSLLDESGGGALAKAYRRRRLRNAAAIGGSGFVVVVALGIIASVRVARGRVDAALSGSEPCAAVAAAEAYLDRASSEQLERVAQRRAACDAARAAEERAAEERRLAEGRARKAEQERIERESRCEALAAHLEAGALSPEDEAAAGASAGLLGRVAKKTPLPSDLGPDAPPLPCAGTKAGDRVVAAFGEALVASVWTWTAVVDPSEQARAALAKRAADIPPRARVMLTVRAEDLSRRAIAMGDPQAIARAGRLCALGDALGLPAGSPCAAVAAMTDMKP